jgi:hypothetical protein
MRRLQASRRMVGGSGIGVALTGVFNDDSQDHPVTIGGTAWYGLSAYWPGRP